MRREEELCIATSHGTLKLRAALGGASEEAFYYLLFSSNKAPEMAFMPIDAKHKEFLLEVQFRSMTNTYRQNYPNAQYRIIELDHWPIGRIVTDIRERYVLYVDFGLLPQAHGLGLGTTILTAMLEEPRRLKLPARLKSLSYNFAALHLYQKLGFEAIANDPPFIELEWRARA